MDLLKLIAISSIISIPYTKVSLEPSQTCKMEFLAEIVNDFQPLTISGKSFFLCDFCITVFE